MSVLEEFGLCFGVICKTGSPGALKLSRILILREHLELVLEQSAVDLQSVGTDRLEREGKVKEFMGIFYLGYTFEISRAVVMAIEGSQDQGRERETGGEGEREREISPSAIHEIERW